MKVRRMIRRGLVAIAVVLAWSAFECGFPTLVEATLPVRDLPAGKSLRLVHLSDVHDAELPGGNVGLLVALRQARPDAVVITGDLIDRGTKDLATAWGWAEGLTAVAKRVFYVPGNHEHWSGWLPELTDGLRRRGVDVLVNRRVTWRSPAGPIEVVGVDDAYTGHDRLAAATAGLAPETCAIALTHAPELVDRLGDAPIDLVLAGHTHGGQVRVPFVGALWAPGQGLLPRWDRGAYDLPGGRRLYIDSGLGTSMLPVRLFARAQASVLTLVPAGPPPPP